MKYIIGGGISGLIYSFYNKGHVIISKNVGGQLKTDFPMGPRILQRTSATTKLLHDLGISAKTRTAFIGYKIDENTFSNICPIGFSRQYYIETRKPLSIDSVPNSTMSDGKTFIEYYDIEMLDLIEHLSQYSHMYNSNVSSIDVENFNIILEDDMEFSYRNSKLISTIPITLLCKLTDAKINHDLRTLDKIYILSDNFKDYHQSYDYIYYIDSVYNRVTRYSHENKHYHIIEYTGLDIETVRLHCKDNHINIVNEIIQRNAQICKSMDSNPFKQYNIELIGRYAKWQHSIKIQDVIEESM
jgi:hypothetical protein